MKKSYIEDSNVHDTENTEQNNEIVVLRENLMNSNDFSNISIEQLLELQNHMKNYISELIEDRNFVLARDAIALNESIRSKIKKLEFEIVKLKRRGVVTPTKKVPSIFTPTYVFTSNYKLEGFQKLTPVMIHFY